MASQLRAWCKAEIGRRKENAFDLGSYRGGPVASSITLVEGSGIISVLTKLSSHEYLRFLHLL